MKKFFEFLNILLCLNILVCVLVPSTVYATDEINAVVNADEVRFRSGPGTSYYSLGYLYQGYKVILKSSNKSSGTGCSAGWYNIYYNGQSGYVCSTYLNVDGEEFIDPYDRPWTSPKKAIVGGAKFISSSYIAMGQNTSYLKKFNVNPSSYYGTYNHQYMANLAAPYNEASTSYNSYKNNGLLSLALHFQIPVYNNMPEYTTHPVTGREEGGTSTVSDTDFEKKLDAQGFPETYKKWLRVIHKNRPNWTFEAIKTNLDFNTSVEREKWVSSINKNSCAKCVDASNTNTEGSWYVGSTEVTAYFLDPRNFLEEDSILMFEDLGNNSFYTEDMVKSVLQGTFMSGCDNIDKISYSSMFMTAAKEANVSPIYLASLSRQEVGTTIGLVTSGEEFSYNGNTYIGFYNFYNIGAYSSESNPAKAGLVYAATGSSKDSSGKYVGNFNGNSNNNNSGNNGNNNNNNNNANKPQVTPVSTHVSRMNLKVKGSYLTNTTLNTTIGTLKSKTTSSELTFKNASGSVVGDSQKVGTGITISFKTDETKTIVVYGDLTGDGVINSADLLRMRQHLLGQVKLSGAYLEAARLVNISGNVNSADLLRMRQYLLGQKNISQA